MKTKCTLFRQAVLSLILLTTAVNASAQQVTVTKIYDTNVDYYTNLYDFRFFYPIPASGGKVMLYSNMSPLVSDGTAAGTLSSGITGTLSNAKKLYASLNDKIIFINVKGTEYSLCKSDGTVAGTQLIATFATLTGNANATFFITSSFGTSLNGIHNAAHREGLIKSVGGWVYFVIRNVGATEPYELWRTDGTLTNTVKLKSFAGQVQAGQFDFKANGVLIFTASQGLKNFYWRSDGTVAGTYALNLEAADVATTQGGEITFNNMHYFIASQVDGAHYALWKTDGTLTGTVMVKDILPGVASGLSVGTCFMPDNDNGVFYFTPENGIGLWKSDGTEAGTGMVSDINNGASVGTSQIGIPYNGKFYFFAPNSVDESGLLTYQNQIWVTDGTEAGTSLFSDPADMNLQFMFKVNGKLVYSILRNNEALLYATDGTAAGTVQLIKLQFSNHGEIVFPVSYPNAGTVVGNNLFVIIPVNYGGGLWQTDGTVAGTYNIPHPLNHLWENIDISGNKLYLSSADDAGSALYVATAPKVAQAITGLEDITKSYSDATFDLAATASSGLPVTYSIANANVATISGNTVHIAGVGTTAITASQAGNDTYSAALDITVNLTVSNSTGIENVHNTTSLSIAGNPVQGGEAKLTFTEAGEGAVLLVTDLTGKTLIQQNLAEGVSSAVIQVEKLSKGVYLVNYSDNNGKRATVKMIK